MIYSPPGSVICQSVTEDRLRANDHPEFEHLIYEEASHLIDPPYYSMQDSVESSGIGSFGGSLAGNAFVSDDHWP
ncbi:acyl-CoA thioester hydrolase/BAAT C-terminal domain-containing protein [Halovenus rubra]|uniref:Acyl-CoA thioester hydrolase/BAAT C-terminal domain-containing protein n=2 Tax=Halovenus rubra TaxID=869890 RepID=A0ACC7DXM1_9EURY|nr:acyl-CoA thioester hydrolase/BAAT C-terminal domain-containing protein [Halovenus rubra]